MRAVSSRCRSIAVAALAIGAFWSAPAAAGTFTVSGTCGLWQPFNNRADRVAVFAQCPQLNTRNTFGSFTTPAGRAGGWTFTAPSGTAISSFAVEAAIYARNGWTSGVYLNGR